MKFSRKPSVILVWAAITVIVVLLLHGLPQAATVVVDADAQYQYARHLYEQGRYLLSAAEYQRFVYFFADDPRARRASLNAGRAYYQAGDLPSAIAQFKALTELSELRELDDVAADAYLMLSECHMRANSPGKALITLHNLMAMARDPALRDKALYRTGWLYIVQLDWTAARRAFEQISAEGRRSHRVDELIKALDTSDSLALKTPALAGTLSIIPGLGQLYCGRYEDALIAFMVDVGLMWASYEAFDNDLNVMGSLLAIVGIGFYASNIYSAVSSAHKYNHAQQQRFADQLQRRFEVGLGSSPHAMGRNLILTLKFNF